MNNEDKYSARSQAVIDRYERSRERNEAKLEAMQENINKFLGKAIKDDNNRRNITRDCLDGYEGRKQGSRVKVDGTSGQAYPDERNSPLTSTPWGDLDPSITGFEDKYWEE